MMQRLKWVGMTVVVVLVVIVVLQNRTPVQTELLFVTLSMPGAALLFGTLLVGFALGLVAGHWWLGRKKK